MDIRGESCILNKRGGSISAAGEHGQALLSGENAGRPMIDNEAREKGLRRTCRLA
jgi:hypothetical protein